MEINPKDGNALVGLVIVGPGNNVIDSMFLVQHATELDPNYISELFDRYSPRFESEFVDGLQYKGHSLLYDDFQKVLKQLGASLIWAAELVCWARLLLMGCYGLKCQG